MTKRKGINEQLMKHRQKIGLYHSKQCKKNREISFFLSEINRQNDHQSKVAARSHYKSAAQFSKYSRLIYISLLLFMLISSAEASREAGESLDSFRSRVGGHNDFSNLTQDQIDFLNKYALDKVIYYGDINLVDALLLTPYQAAAIDSVESRLQYGDRASIDVVSVTAEAYIADRVSYDPLKSFIEKTNLSKDQALHLSNREIFRLENFIGFFRAGMSIEYIANLTEARFYELEVLQPLVEAGRLSVNRAISFSKEEIDCFRKDNIKNLVLRNACETDYILSVSAQKIDLIDRLAWLVPNSLKSVSDILALSETEIYAATYIFTRTSGEQHASQQLISRGVIPFSQIRTFTEAQVNRVVALSDFLDKDRLKLMSGVPFLFEMDRWLNGAAVYWDSKNRDYLKKEKLSIEAILSLSQTEFDAFLPFEEFFSQLISWNKLTFYDALLLVKQNQHQAFQSYFVRLMIWKGSLSVEAATLFNDDDIKVYLYFENPQVSRWNKIIDHGIKTMPAIFNPDFFTHYGKELLRTPIVKQIQPQLHMDEVIFSPIEMGRISFDKLVSLMKAIFVKNAQSKFTIGYLEEFFIEIMRWIKEGVYQYDPEKFTTHYRKLNLITYFNRKTYLGHRQFYLPRAGLSLSEVLCFSEDEIEVALSLVGEKLRGEGVVFSFKEALYFAKENSLSSKVASLFYYRQAQDKECFQEASDFCHVVSLQ